MNVSPVDVGRMRQRVTIQNLDLGVAPTPNSLGERKPTWVNIGEVWAEVRPIGAKERLRMDVDVVQDTTHIVTVRYIAGITSTDNRLVFNGRVLAIVGVVNVRNLNRYLEITCNETSEVIQPDPSPAPWEDS